MLLFVLTHGAQRPAPGVEIYSVKQSRAQTGMRHAGGGASKNACQQASLQKKSTFTFATDVGSVSLASASSRDVVHHPHLCFGGWRDVWFFHPGGSTKTREDRGDDKRGVRLVRQESNSRTLGFRT